MKVLVLTWVVVVASSLWGAEVLVDAEGFECRVDLGGVDYVGNVLVYGDGDYDKGDRGDTGWVLDGQFMDEMGSPYLLAHGLGRPVSDARKVVRFGEGGRYRVWVRTFDWVGPWRGEPEEQEKTAGKMPAARGEGEEKTAGKMPATRAGKRARGDAPGRFEVLVNGEALRPVEVGNAPEATAFGAAGTAWHWQDGGVVEVEAGEVEVRLHDLTGFEGRCDAIYFTTELGFRPPNEPAALRRWRRGLLGTLEAVEGGSYDLVVVGGGVAGMCATLQAARQGLEVALVQDRLVVGGNNSSEVRVHLLGSICHEPYPCVGTIVKEVVQLADRHYGPENSADVYADAQNIALLDAQDGVTLYLGRRVNEVETDGDRIVAVVAEDTRTGERVRLTGRWFVDSTGDGAVGYLAGADHEVQLYDGTIESVHLGQSNIWCVVETESAVEFPACPWAFEIGENPILFGDNPDKLGGWAYESGYKRDPIADGERIRDGNFRGMYGVWDALKNERGLYPNHVLHWAAYVTGKRESRRLMGDHVLTRADIVEGVEYADGCVPITRDIDLHYPREKENAGLEGDEFVAYAKFEKYQGPYWIPYRCFYSRNVANLFMAGRDASFTHEALGAPRVMRTCGMMGEVVGMAAAVCRDRGVDPRGVYDRHLDELLERLRGACAGG